VGRFFNELLRLCKISLRLGGKVLEARGNFFGLRAECVPLFFPAILDFTETRLEMTKNLFAGGPHQGFEALLGKFVKLLEIPLPDGFDPGEGSVDSIVQLCSEGILNDQFGSALQLSLHGGD
jgi:hypothetical protein